MLRARRRWSVRDAVLLSGDVLCFLAFAVLGLRSHETGITPEALLRAEGTFADGWFIVVFALGVKRRDDVSMSRGVLRAWVPAWALGMIIRTLAFDRDFEVTFAVVSLLVIGVLLMVWRGLLAPLALRFLR
jgi:hypothetical protein